MASASQRTYGSEVDTFIGEKIQLRRPMLDGRGRHNFLVGDNVGSVPNSGSDVLRVQLGIRIQ